MYEARRHPGTFAVALSSAALLAVVACGGGGDAGTGGGATGGTATGGAATGGSTTGGGGGTGLATGGAPRGGGPSNGGRAAGGRDGASGGGHDGGAPASGGGRGGREPSGGTAPGGATGATGGVGGAAGPLGTSDEFEGTSLGPSWTVFRGDLVDIAVANGSVSLTPHAKALWYQASQGPLVYKTVTGDFKVTATVHARKASDRTMTPTQFADVGGLMARNPSSSAENYVLGVVGYAEMNQLAVENKSTTNGSSKYGEVAFGADAELRLCRSGATFSIFHRRPGDTAWISSVTPISRADLPATLQVGMIAYTGAPSPDYVSIFDRIAFEPVGAGCNQ